MEKTFGMVLSPSPVRSYDFDICCGATAAIDLPEEFELDIDSFSDVKDQLWTNACVAFASSLVGECENYKRTGKKDKISTGYTYGHRACRGSYMGYGMYMEDAMKGLVKIGFIPNILFDVVEDMPDIYEKVNNRSDLDTYGQNLKPKAYISLKTFFSNEKNIENIKKALYTYRCPIPMSSATFFGSPHCVAIYGWDKDNNFKFQNSWGPSYENSGRHIIDIDNIFDAYVLVFNDIDIPFTDIDKNAWYYKSLRNVILSGLMNGISETIFDPDNNIKRCDIAVVLKRMFDKLEQSVNTYLKTKQSQGYKVKFIDFKGEKDISYTDIDSGKYYVDSIDFISKLGIINGYEDNSFRPNNNITRAEFATIIARTYDYLREIIDGGIEWVDLESTYGYTLPYDKFTDVSEDSWYYEFVKKANKLGLMTGDSKELFDPINNITRAECGVVLERLFAKIDAMLKLCALL